MLIGVVAAACSVDPGYKGRQSGEWIQQLSESSAERRAQAADALGEVLALSPKYRPAVDALLRALTDTSDIVRIAAGSALAKPGVPAEGAVPGLIAAAGDSAHSFTRVQAVQILGTLARTMPPRAAQTQAPRLAAALSAALGDPNAEVRARAADGLSLMGPAARQSPATIPALVGLARDPDPRLRFRALEALANAEAPADVAVRIHERALADSSTTVRVVAAFSLGRLGAPAGAAGPALAAALRDADAQVRVAAAVALGMIGPPAGAAEAALRRARADPDPAVRREATHSLTQFHQRGGQDPRAPEPTLQEKCLNAPRGTPGC